ncbi:MAG TPA: hypothetical protein ENI20_16610 [Bacteroides sp.]|nr:hypothetical protein [Bacteroides sp.]
MKTNDWKLTGGLGQVNGSCCLCKIAIRINCYVTDLYCPDIVGEGKWYLEPIGIQEVLNVLGCVGSELFCADN